MKVLLLGSGGREHALAHKLSQSPHVSDLFCAPGNAGTSGVGVNVPLDLGNLDDLASFARQRQVDLTVVGPEVPLVAGVTNRFRAEGIPVAGPTSEAAQLEGSKVFAKEFMRRHGIPTAAFEVFDSAAEAEKALRSGRFSLPVVVKAEGLAAGKGVLICRDLPSALSAIESILVKRTFGDSGSRIVLEEFLEGEELSFMVVTDGKAILPMVPSQDHKAVFEGDQGPNTGGMGAYSVDFLLSPELRRQVIEKVIEPTVLGMAESGNAFQGVLYAGLMLTEAGPRVLEFNVRFGDPEAQAVIPRLKSDLFELLLGVATRDLSGASVEWSSDAAVCVVLASGGYPGPYETGREISGISMAEEISGTIVFHAGTELRDNSIVTSGGRVLGVTSVAPTLEAAIVRAYEGVNKVHFPNMYYRRDIGAKGLRKLGIES